MKSAVVSMLALAGCFGDDAFCLDTESPSVRVEVVDEFDRPFADATVEFLGPMQRPPFRVCELDGAVYECGTELAGELAITVTKPGFQPFSGTAVVGTNNCGVITTDLRVVLQPE